MRSTIPASHANHVNHSSPIVKRIVYLWPYVLIAISLIGLAIKLYRAVL